MSSWDCQWRSLPESVDVVLAVKPLLSGVFRLKERPTTCIWLKREA